MKKVAAILLFIMVCILSFECDANPKTPSKKQLKQWHKVLMTDSTGNTEETTRLCRELICKGKFEDSLVICAREKLSSIYLYTDVAGNEALNGVYEQLVYFEKLLKIQPENIRAQKVLKILSEKYRQMLQSENSKMIPEGIYISNVNIEGRPLLAIEFTSTQSGEIHARLLRSCDLAKMINPTMASWLTLFEYEPKYDLIEIPKPVQVNSADSSLWVLTWGNDELRKGDAEMAKTIASSSMNFKAEMAKSMATSKMGSGGYAAASLSTTLIGAFLDVTAIKVASSKAISQALSICFESGKNDEILSHISYRRVTMSIPNSEPNIKDFNQSIRLYRIFPHYDSFFYVYDDFMWSRGSSAANSSQTPYDYYRANYFGHKKYLPFLIKNNGKIPWNRSAAVSHSGINKTAYSSIVIARYFKIIDELNIRKYLPRLRDMSVEWDNDGNVLMYKFNKKKNGYEGLVCRRNSDNTIVFSLYDKGQHIDDMTVSADGVPSKLAFSISPPNKK